LLDKNALPGEYDDPTLAKMSGHGMMKLPAFRDAEGVCEDFLREVYKYVSSKLGREMTLPAIWSEEAKDSTLKAARRAGFGSRAGDDIFTIAEPEAAAIATLKKYSGPNAFNPIKVCLLSLCTLNKQLRILVWRPHSDMRLRWWDC
jgi:hypothetical protein